MLGFSIQRQKPSTLPLLIPQIFGALQRTQRPFCTALKPAHKTPQTALS